MNKVSPEQPRALYHMSQLLVGHPRVLVKNSTLGRTLQGLTAPLHAGSDRIYLTSAIYRQAFAVRSPSHMNAYVYLQDCLDAHNPQSLGQMHGLVLKACRAGGGPRQSWEAS